jgi:hypothetical protein
MDVSTLTTEQLIDCLRITGYTVAPNEYKLARTTSDAQVYVPNPTNPRYLIIVEDEQSTRDEQLYMVITLHLRFCNGQIGAEYGAAPLVEALSEEEALAYVNGARAVIMGFV